MSKILITIAVLFTVIFLYYSNGSDVGPEQIISNMSDVEETMFNLTTNTIPYTSFYKEEITMKGVAFNLVNGIAYNLVVMLNTIIPILIYVASGSYAPLIIKLIIVYLVITLALFIVPFLKLLIAFWFFIREKRNKKEGLLE